jgi:hypothetical protein
MSKRTKNPKARNAPTAPIDTGAQPPREYPGYTMRHEPPGSLIGGWHIYRQDPDDQGVYHILGQGLDEDEARACVGALNALAEGRHRATIGAAVAETVGAAVAGGTERDKVDCLKLAINTLHARRVLGKGEHTFAYYAEESLSWWLVTDASMIALGAALSSAGASPVDEGGAKGTAYRGVIDAWAESDKTARELDRSGRRALRLPEDDS